MNEVIIFCTRKDSHGVQHDQRTMEIEFFANWRANKSEIGLLPTERPKELKEIFTPSLLLNFSAQLLYMMSHYIIEPSSMNYIRELGGNDALSGLLIGMAPAAALVSAFGYSLWSNRSFREPLLCAGVFQIIGSITYASALRFQSISMATTGRFIQGLGAPCVMNIRHIADPLPRRKRHRRPRRRRRRRTSPWKRLWEQRRQRRWRWRNQNQHQHQHQQHLREEIG